MNDIAGVNDHGGWWMERVDIGNRALEIAHSLLGIACIQCDMRIGDLRNDHRIGL
jgi:hypothetical protein